MLHIDFPFAFDDSGKTATTTWSDHNRDMLLQFLLTYPGERVNRPDFGTPLSRVCFEGNSAGLAEVVQFIARAGLDRWLGQVIEVIELSAHAQDAVLVLDLKYRVRGEDEVRVEQRQLPMGTGGLL